MLCAICCGPLRPPRPADGGEWKEDVKWQTRMVLLTDPESEFETLEQHYCGGKRKGIARLHRSFDAAIQRHRATVVGNDRCRLEEHGVEIKPYWSGYDDFGNAPPISYSIPTHEACVDLASRIVRNPRPDVHVRSFRTLWKVLRTRLDARDSEYMISVDAVGPQHVVIDNNYYMPLDFVNDDSVWEGGDSHWVVADPTCIPDLTLGLIENVRHLESSSDMPANLAVKTFRGLFMTLPPELRDRALTLMGSLEGLPTKSTYLLPQGFWRDMLLGGRYLPFLWDIDHKIIEEFVDEHRAPECGLDWEHLVRKLSQGVETDYAHYEMFAAQTSLPSFREMNLPRGFRNRRRIWQLIEEMYVGDVLPVSRGWVTSETLPTMPRYWDEDGQQVYPILRVSGLSGEG